MIKVKITTNDKKYFLNMKNKIIFKILNKIIYKTTNKINKI